MATKRNDGYMSARESRRISKENRRITNELEKKRKRKNVPEAEYLTQMHDPNNAVEFDNLHTYFFTDTGVVKNKMIRTVCPVAKEEAELLTYVLNQTLTGIPIEEITKERFDIVRRAAGMTALLKPIGEFIEDLLEELSTQKLYLQGASKLLSQPEYRDVAKAQALLDYIGDSSHVPALRRFTREIDGVRITIGPENGVEPLENASMVYATYNIGTVGRGLIGIVGPTRMDYGRLSARLSLFSQGLNKLIAETFFDEVEDDKE